MEMKWFDAQEQRPDADLTVLIYSPKLDPDVWVGYFDGEMWLTADGQPAGKVKHWMHLPDPPPARKKPTPCRNMVDHPT